MNTHTRFLNQLLEVKDFERTYIVPIRSLGKLASKSHSREVYAVIRDSLAKSERPSQTLEQLDARYPRLPQLLPA